MCYLPQRPHSFTFGDRGRRHGERKVSDLSVSEYLTTAITRLYQALDEFLTLYNANGIVFFDRANEKHITTHVRKLLGTGASGESIPGVKLSKVIEDPVFRISADSMFIQATDVIAYTLKEKEFPQGSRKKYQAHKIFQRKLSNICFISKYGNEEGIIKA